MSSAISAAIFFATSQLIITWRKLRLLAAVCFGLLVVYAANGIDLMERRQTRGTNSELLASFTYNAQHLPVTWTNASGQTTTVIYNSRGQKLSSQNPKLETTTYAYGGTVPDGYLKSITSPLFNNVSAVTEFTYDTAHRVLTTTDSDQYVLTFEYDDLDRPT